MNTFRIEYTVKRGNKITYNEELVEIYANTAIEAERRAILFITENREIEASDIFIVNQVTQIADIPKPTLDYLKDYK